MTMNKASSPAPALVLIPTYNELTNLPIIIGAVQSSAPDVHVLIIDDNSPDGTGELADRIAAQDERLHVLHRTEKNGLGAAYLAGFGWGLEQGYPVLIEMDADGSHPAETLPALISAVSEPGAFDLAIGSRWVTGGRVVNWPKSREFISKSGNFYAEFWLHTGVKDATAGFRAFRADVLRNIHLETVISQGYCFQIDMTLRVLDAGYTITEIPIEFREREHGVSKMSKGIVFEAMWKVTQWGIGHIFNPRRKRVKAAMAERAALG